VKRKTTRCRSDGARKSSAVPVARRLPAAAACVSPGAQKGGAPGHDGEEAEDLECSRMGEKPNDAWLRISAS